MSENAFLKDQNTERKYFTILPNILSRLGLTAFERSLYWAIKENCGPTGSSTKSYVKLAEMAGMGLTALKTTLKSLSENNKVLLKPLILVKSRLTENGDKDTNEITVVDLWDENIESFKKIIGQSPRDLPKSLKDLGQSANDGGVSRHATEGESPRDYKQDIKTNYVKTTTTTNKSSSSSFTNQISNEVKEMAAQMFETLKLRATKILDEKWNLDRNTIEKNLQRYGVDYGIDQLNYLLERMNKYQKDKVKQGNKTTPIDDPKIYFNKACKENYANSLNLKT